MSFADSTSTDHGSIFTCIDWFLSARKAFRFTIETATLWTTGKLTFKTLTNEPTIQLPAIKDFNSNVPDDTGNSNIHLLDYVSSL